MLFLLQSTLNFFFVFPFWSVRTLILFCQPVKHRLVLSPQLQPFGFSIYVCLLWTALHIHILCPFFQFIRTCTIWQKMLFREKYLSKCGMFFTLGVLLFIQSVDIISPWPLPLVKTADCMCSFLGSFSSVISFFVLRHFFFFFCWITSCGGTI